MVTPKKPAWPSIGHLPKSIYKHILLALNANQTIVEMIKTNIGKDKWPSTNIFFMHLKKLSNSFTQIKDNPKGQSILDTI